MHCHLLKSRNYITRFLIIILQNILPLSEEQRFLVNDLSTAFFDQPLESPAERLCDEILNPPPFDPANLPINDVDDDNFDLPQCPQPATIPTMTCSELS